MHKYITIYKDNKTNKTYTAICKPVASKQHAISAFESETNSFKTLTMLHCVKIVN
mgnify:CR=1 FL=1